MELHRYFVFLAGLLALSCTSTNSQKTSYPLSAQEILPKEGGKDLDQFIDAIDRDIEKPIKPAPNFEEQELDVSSNNTEVAVVKTEKNHRAIPLDINDRVKKWITYFTEKDRDRFQRFINRGARYRNLIMQILEQYDVPTDLYYLAMIESGFTNHAYSTAGAMGPWQFMSGTGKGYGLAVNHFLDERRDPVWATHAAAQYLSDLFRVYQSWFLAMASYNAGGSRIMHAVMRANTRDFWQLVEKRALPKETMDYIPKFIAAAIIGHHLEEFGFTEPDEVDWQDTSLVSVPKGLLFSDISKATGIPSSDLKRLNPSIRRGQVPYSKRSENFRVLTKDVNKLSSQKAYFAKLSKKRSMTQVASRRSEQSSHLVASGDSLHKIALNSGTSVNEIIRWNNLKSSRIFRGQRLKLYSTRSPRTSGKTASLMFHRVRRGESLTAIGRKYGQSIGSIKKLNRLRSNKIFVGQRLKVSRSQKVTKRYKVRRGDNLQAIASRFKTSVVRLKKLNKIRRSRIYAGQFLRVPAY